jgi:hypothetical protein
MKDIIFTDKTAKPTQNALIEILGKTFSLWEELLINIQTIVGDITEEWKYYGGKSGWQLKILLNKRNLFFFVPGNKLFSIIFIFGDKAVSVIEKSDLPGSIIERLINTPKYAEGRGIRIDVKSKKDLGVIQKLISIKLDN